MKSTLNTTTTMESPEGTRELHEQVSQLLPWYINESLTKDEHALVEAHLQHCQHCQQALANEHVLLNIGEQNIAIPNVDAAFEKMMSRIEPSSAIATKEVSNVPHRYVDFVNWIRTKWLLPVSIPMGWLVLPQFAVLLIAVLAMTDLLKYEPNYQALSNSDPNSSNVVIVFKSKANLTEVTGALQRFDARIVDGPTVTNAYLLQVPGEQIERVVEELRMDKNVEYIHQLKDGEKHESLPN
jgi:hypothetical protein